MRCNLLTSLLVLWALPLDASAQNFNLDVGANMSHPLPASTYGAAASQPGTWFGVSTTAQVAVTLTDINAVVTAVTITPTGGFGDFAVGNPTWFGDDDMLMEDASDVGGTWQGAPGGLITWTVSGLAAGTYEVYSYTLAPDFPATYRTSVDVPGAPEGLQVVGGAWSGSPHVLGVSYAKHTIVLSAGQTLTIVTADPGVPSNNFATVNGFQFKFSPGPVGSSFCPGDGSGTACPCGNNAPGGSASGCLNSLGSGASVTATGIASIAGDSVTLFGTGMPNSSALFFQGTAQQAGGAGAVFGDGLRCASGTVIRLGTKTNVAGASQYPDAGDPSISVRGAITTAGTRTYQVWYRNAAAFCTVSTFNLSNGRSVNWSL